MFTDSNSKININDGVAAGQLEQADDEKRASVANWKYNASTLDPWPTNDLSNPDKSGLNNLRIRRLLNAYGDACMAQDKDLLSEASGSLPTNFAFTSSGQLIVN